MFLKFSIDYGKDIFHLLSNSITFEDIGNGRKGANLIDYKNETIPIVRTTTSYNNPSQVFSSVHYDLIEKIKNVSEIKELELNNALAEIYEPTYRNMRFHSDQALDLVSSSYICIFSCYDDPSTAIKRKLKIKNKQTDERFEILLDHNSVIIFSTEINKTYAHKIVADSGINSRWLGITFRLSKIFIKFDDITPYFYPEHKILTIATENQVSEFLKHKSLENSGLNYSYPEIFYTLSPGDLINPK
jgi:hypothetical protein